MRIYVGNLSQDTAQPQLRQAFEPFGEVSRVSLAVDKLDRSRKGFGFVEMPSDDEAQAAILGLNGTELDGKTVSVNEARTSKSR